MRKSYSTQALESSVLRYCLLAAAAWSVVSNLLDLDSRWHAPLIFLGLYAVLRAIEELQRDQKDGKATPLNHNAEFYPMMERATMESTSHISVTYMRTYPPPHFQSAEFDDYFKSLERWARRNPNRQLRRVIGAPSTGSMDGWIVSHHKDTVSLRNYAARVVPCSSSYDCLNMAIFDDRRCVVAITGSGHEVRGVAIDDPTVARSFSEYHSSLWAQGEPLEVYADRLRKSH